MKAIAAVPPDGNFTISRILGGNCNLAQIVYAVMIHFGLRKAPFLHPFSRSGTVEARPHIEARDKIGELLQSRQGETVIAYFARLAWNTFNF